MNSGNPELDFLGKNILVTGGSEGLGLSLCKRIVRNGGNIVFCARTKKNIVKIEKELNQNLYENQKIKGLVVDISKPDEVNDMYLQTKLEYPYFDVLINNAGIIGEFGKFLDVNFFEWQKTFQVNFFSSAFIIYRFLPDMLARKKGKIIQLSGGGATSTLRGMSAYSASKTAVVRLIENLSVEYKETGIAFNCVAPGLIRSRLLKQMINAGPDIIGQNLFEKSTQKNTESSDSTLLACELIQFLISDKSDGISGKLISAEWDNWQNWPNHIDALSNSDIYTLRRVVGRDRNELWGDI
jgi:short-subunit dehydrogenase